MSRPSVFFQQPVWTALGLAVVLAGPLAVAAAWSGYVPDDDKPAVVVTGLVLTALTVVVTVVAIAGTARERRVWRDLDTAGVRVLGQVTSAERVLVRRRPLHQGPDAGHPAGPATVHHEPPGPRRGDRRGRNEHPDRRAPGMRPLPPGVDAPSSN